MPVISHTAPFPQTPAAPGLKCAMSIALGVPRPRIPWNADSSPLRFGPSRKFFGCSASHPESLRIALVIAGTVVRAGADAKAELIRC
jgi:hypothetical protein